MNGVIFRTVNFNLKCIKNLLLFQISISEKSLKKGLDYNIPLKTLEQIPKPVHFEPILNNGLDLLLLTFKMYILTLLLVNKDCLNKFYLKSQENRSNFQDMDAINKRVKKNGTLNQNHNINKNSWKTSNNLWVRKIYHRPQKLMLCRGLYQTTWKWVGCSKRSI